VILRHHNGGSKPCDGANGTFNHNDIHSPFINYLFALAFPQFAEQTKNIRQTDNERCDFARQACE